MTWLIEHAHLDPAKPVEKVGTSGVLVADLPELGGAAAVASRDFQAGERVFEEPVLVIAPSATNLARVRAYCQLPAEKRRLLREDFFGEAPPVRCAATAACSGEVSGDSAAEVLATLRAEGQDDLALAEVEDVIRVWNLNAYDNALAPVACKVSHSCAPNLTIRVDAIEGIIEGTACRQIVAGEALGSWYIQDTGVWWMGADIRRSFLKQDRGFSCLCTRCQSPDACRALPCDACGAGTVLPQGHSRTTSEAQPTWRCASCSRDTLSGDLHRSTAEAQLTHRMLLELKPPRGVPKASPEELVALAGDVRSRLGDEHWISAAAALVLHFRCRPEGGLLNPLSVACGCRFLGWLLDKKLPLPPAPIVRTPIAVAIDCIAWLGQVPDVASGASQAFRWRDQTIKDQRSIASRLLQDWLLPIFMATGGTIAKVANTGARVASLKEWLSNLRSTCGHCSKKLDGQHPLVCGRCKQVRYCSRACQQANWKDHKGGCLPIAESLAGELAFKLIANT